MTRPSGPVETKVAASSLAALVVTGVFACAANWHWFTPPPPYLTGLLITAVTWVAGWLAPHTHVPVRVTEIPVNDGGSLVKFASPITDAEAAEIRRRWMADHPRKPAIGDLRAGAGPGHPAEIFTGPGWETYQPEPAVQPEATTSGPTGKVTP